MGTLSQLVETLGPSVVEAVAAPAGMDVEVNEVVVYDPLDPAHWGPGSLVMGVGIEPDEDRLTAALARSDIAGLVIKLEEGATAALASVAGRLGFPLLGIPRSASWAHVILLFRSIASQSRQGSPQAREGIAPGDMFAVANLVADWIDAPVTIEDPQSHLLAFSSLQENADLARTATILGRQTPERYLAELRRARVFERLRTTTEPMYLHSDLPGVTSRVVAPLRAGDEFLGMMWAVSDTPFSPDRQASFAEAARFAAIHVLHNRFSDDLERRHHSDLVDAILRGGSAAADAARRLGIQGDTFRVLALAPRASEAAREALLIRCANVLSLQLSATHRGAVSARIGDAVYAVIPTGSGANRSLVGARQAIDGLRGRSEAELREALLVAIGGHCESFAEISRSKAEADQVLRVLRENPTGRQMAEIEEVRIQVMLLRLADVMAQDPAAGAIPLARIEAYDQRHSSNYFQTLKAYLDSFGDPTKTSALLGIHTNTLRYRLRRLGELFGVNLDDQDERLGLMLQIRLSRISKP